MEPRGCLAQYDPDDDRYTIRCTVQSVHGPRAMIAEQIFKLPHHKFRIVCDNMGGGFGMKGGTYPEYALSLWAAEVTGRPVPGLRSAPRASSATSRVAAASLTLS